MRERIQVAAPFPQVDQTQIQHNVDITLNSFEGAIDSISQAVAKEPVAIVTRRRKKLLDIGTEVGHEGYILVRNAIHLMLSKVVEGSYVKGFNDGVEAQRAIHAGGAQMSEEDVK